GSTPQTRLRGWELTIVKCAGGLWGCNAAIESKFNVVLRNAAKGTYRRYLVSVAIGIHDGGYWANLRALRCIRQPLYAARRRNPGLQPLAEPCRLYASGDIHRCADLLDGLIDSIAGDAVSVPGAIA